ncbi:MAG: L,D-transpeptidase family protein, partial [Nitrospinota bacterium]
KEKEGDLKTPVGYYRIVEVKDGDTLPSIYGPRAFVLNYPNSFDTALGRTGGGIWLHGSGKGKRTPDTRGCVELDDDKIIALGDWVGIDTAVAIFPENFSLPVVNGRLEKQYISTRFFYGDTSDLTSG